MRSSFLQTLVFYSKFNSQNIFDTGTLLNYYVYSTYLLFALIPKIVYLHYVHVFSVDRRLLSWLSTTFHRGTQRLLSVKYLFGEADLVYNFLLLEDD